MRYTNLVTIVFVWIMWFLVFSYLVFVSLPQTTDSYFLFSSSDKFNAVYKKNFSTRTNSSIKNRLLNNPISTDNSLVKSEVNIPELFNLRYWNLVNNLNNLTQTELVSLPSVQNLWLKGSVRNNLWRPKRLNSMESDRIVQQLVYQMEASQSHLIKKSKLKWILLWNGFNWWNKASWNSNGTKYYLEPSDCYETPGSITNCVFTEQKDKLNEVNAVIYTKNWEFHRDIQIPKNILSFTYMLESPYHSSALLNRSEQLLATYWRGSDIVTPYRKWMYFNSNKTQMNQEKSYHAGKSLPAAIFVSNCWTPNNRSGYIKELQKYIQVDVYGRCGPKKCKDSLNGTKCNEMLKKDYYFYLSFENSNCRDYITEKFFHTAFNNDVIPVAFGAHPEDYKYAAPLNSYILAEDFKSPKQLAAYLKYLIRNSSEYEKYFKWKGTGKFITSEFLCTLCAMVNYADLVPPPKRRVPFIWGNQNNPKSEQMCLKSNEWFWNKNS